MLRTRFTDLVGCSVPIQQAGMGAAATPELAAAVANAGGLGMLGAGRAGGPTLAGVTMLVEQTRALTDKPFGINFLVPPGAIEDFEPGCLALAAQSARVIEFFYGWPDQELVKIVHDNGALVSWQVGSAEEAFAAADVGCDMIVAQGVAAGGHVRGTVGVMALLEEVLMAKPGVPVLAAGGIGSGRAMAAALAAGADGVRVGTRFVAAREADVHPIYVQKLIAARAEDTIYTGAFHVGWEDAPHRVLGSCIAAAEAINVEVIGDRPSLDGTRVPVRRFSCLVPTHDTTGAIEAMSLWAGESVSAVHRVQPAAEIIAELVFDAEEALRRDRATV
jgi:NAD(P)H-dependent flavin oxidoreductase YrpB (nitropropane dioxygenase family)